MSAAGEDNFKFLFVEFHQRACANDLIFGVWRYHYENVKKARLLSLNLPTLANNNFNKSFNNLLDRSSSNDAIIYDQFEKNANMPGIVTPVPSKNWQLGFTGT